LTFSWCCADGKNYHGHCLPVPKIDADRDAAANIDRLTAQVRALQESVNASLEHIEALKDDRDEYIAKLEAVTYQLDGTGTRVDDTGEYASSEALRLARRLQEQLTAAERERDELIRQLIDTQHDRYRIMTERDKATMYFKRMVEQGVRADRLKSELDEAVSSETHAAWKEVKARVRVLETAIESVDKFNRQHEDYRGSANVYTRAIRDVVIAALTTASPSTGAELAAKHGFQRLSDEAFKRNVERECARVAPPAETPAPTCKWCSRPPRENDNVCETCHGFLVMVGGRGSPVARDTLADAPALVDATTHCLECDRPFQIDAEIDRLRAAVQQYDDKLVSARAELAAEKKRYDVLAGLASTETLRLGNALAAANAEIAVLKWESDERLREINRLNNAHAATTAKLGAAVEMVNVLANHLESAADVIADCDVLDPEDEEDDEARALIARAREFVADAESREAGEVWAEMVAAIEKARALDKSLQVKHWGYDGGESYSQEHDDLRKALAKVDARRGGGR
jgi:DNA repair exonuclease SbcCD ATPase subunit